MSDSVVSVPTINIPEISLIIVMLVISLIIGVGAFRMAMFEFYTNKNDFRYDMYRGVCVSFVCLAGASLVSLAARAVDADVPMVTWPWLGQSYWICHSCGILFWIWCRIEARLKHHPFWPSDDVTNLTKTFND